MCDFNLDKSTEDEEVDAKLVVEKESGDNIGEFPEEESVLEKKDIPKT